MAPPLLRASTALLLLATLAAPAAAQTRSARDTAITYDARLDAKSEPADLHQRWVNNRIQSRNNSRLALQVEHYRPDSTDDPVAAFRTAPDDRSRTTPLTAPPARRNNQLTRRHPDMSDPDPLHLS